ncbi:hypothetical protein JB92DRAFT_2827254 [Gautieria morchelliformis]|nr:hypothetical protein JB92DRAFT_2827254 [Gautieria morchelliformis]
MYCIYLISYYIGYPCGLACLMTVTRSRTQVYFTTYNVEKNMQHRLGGSCINNELSSVTVLEIVELLPEVNWATRIVGRLEVMKLISELPRDLQQCVIERKKVEVEQLRAEINMECELSKSRKREEEETYYESKRRLIWSSVDDNSTFLNLVDLTVQLECFGKFIDKSSSKYTQQAVCCVCTLDGKIKTRYIAPRQDGQGYLRSGCTMPLHAQYIDFLKPLLVGAIFLTAIYPGVGKILNLLLAA